MLIKNVVTKVGRFYFIKPGLQLQLNTFQSSVIFFYSHISLIIISLIPSSIRSVQMWRHLTTPFLDGTGCGTVKGCFMHVHDCISHAG